MQIKLLEMCVRGGDVPGGGRRECLLLLLIGLLEIFVATHSSFF